MADDEVKEVAVPPAAEPNHVSGPTDDLEALYAAHAKSVLRAAHRVTGNMQDAEDVLHTVFCRLLSHATQHDLSPSPGGYLRRAAINAALDVVRSPKSRTVGIESVELRLADAPDRNPDAEFDARELAKHVRGALASVSRKSAEIFTLKFFEGYGNQEIAQLVDSTPGTVAVSLHRTRKQIRASLGELLGDAS